MERWMRGEDNTIKVAMANISSLRVKVVHSQENFTSMPKIIKVEILTHVHPSVRFLRLTKSSFANRSNSILPLAGRLKQFLPSWKKLRKDLTFIKGYIIPNRNQEKLIGNEINKLLEKKASSHICHQKGDFSAECFW